MRLPTFQQLLIILIPVFLILLCVVSIALPIILNLSEYLLISIIFYFLPSLIILICIFILRRRNLSHHDLFISSNRVSQKLCVIIFFIFQTTAIISCHLTDERPTIYIFIIVIMTGIIAFQLFLKKYSSTLILFQIAILTFNVLYSMTMNYPLYFGGTDIMNIADVVNVVAIIGDISPNVLGTSYYDWPLYFIYVSMSCLLSGIGNTTTEIVKFIQLLSPLICLSTTIIIYKISKYLTKNTHIALYCSLLYSIFPVWISFSYYILPRTLSYSACLFIVCLLFIRYTNSAQNINHKWPAFLILEGILFVNLLLVHQLTVLLILSLLTLGMLIWVLFFRKFNFIREFIVAYIITFGYWFFFHGWTFFSYQISTKIDFFYAENTDPIIQGYSMGNISDIIPYLLGNAYWIVIFIILVIGCYAILSGKLLELIPKKYSKLIIVIAILGIGSLVLYIPSPLTISSLASTFAIDRFQLVCLPFIVLLLSISIYYLSMHFPIKKRINYGVIFAILCVLIISLSSIVFSDDYMNNIFDQRDRYFTDSELLGIAFITEHVPTASTLSTDHFLHRYFLKKNEEVVSSGTNLPYYSIKTITNVFKNFEKYEGYTLIRTSAFYQTGLYSYYEEYHKYSPTEDNIILLNKFVEFESLIYNNNDSSILIRYI